MIDLPNAREDTSRKGVNLNYFEEVMSSLEEKMGDRDKGLLTLYALLVLSKGSETSCEDVHDAWSGWINLVNPEHKYLVPFNELPEMVQAYDEFFRDAILEVANGRSH